MDVLRKLVRTVVLTLFLMALPVLASAQALSLATLSSPDLEEFPRISAFLDVRDAQGYFVSSLVAEDITINEDGQQLFAAELAELRPGAHIVVAVNPGPSFDVRDTLGYTRYGLFSNAIGAWAVSLTADPIDALSLVTPAGILASRQTDANEWLTAWQGYQPDFGAAEPGLDVLSQAIDLALDAPPQEGMGRAVFFITPIMALESIDTLQNLTDRAREGQVRVYVVAIDAPDMLNSSFAGLLQTLPTQTGGQYLNFTGAEELPDFNTLFESPRRTYQLVYNSRVSTAGVHDFNVIVDTPQGQIPSQLISYEIALRPPNPVIVSPPNQILRAVPPDAELSLENLAPGEQIIEMVVDFPDTIQREITHSVLYINDEVADENNAPPFDRFTIDLDPYQASELVMLRVEATDELGLTGSGIDTPVQITVQPPRTDFSAMLARNTALVAGSAVVVAGLVFFLILVIAGRIRPRQLGERKSKRAAYTDPVTQPLSKMDIERNRQALAGANNVITRLTRPRTRQNTEQLSKAPSSEPIAYLVQVSEEDLSSQGKIIPVTRNEIIFGSDPETAQIVVDDPAVEAVHARLWRDAQGVFYIADIDSVAGTWLNYSPVSPDGTRLTHGDLLHIARNGFRFTESQNGNRHQPQVTPLEESA